MVELLPTLSLTEDARTGSLGAVDTRYLQELCEELLQGVLSGKPVVALTGGPAERLRRVVDRLQPLLIRNGVWVVRIGSPDGTEIDMRTLCRLVLATGTAASAPDQAERFFHILTNAAGCTRHVLLIVEDAERLARDSFDGLQQIMAAVAAGARPLQVLLVGSQTLWDRLPSAGAFAASLVRRPVLEGYASPPGRIPVRPPRRDHMPLDVVAAMAARSMAPADAPAGGRARRLAAGGALLGIAGVCGAIVLRYPLASFHQLDGTLRAFGYAIAASAPPAAPPAAPPRVVAAMAPPDDPPPVVLREPPATPVAPAPPARAPSVAAVAAPPPRPQAPAAPRAAPAPASQAVLTGLLARAGSLMALGDVATARLVYQRAAELGSAEAATAAGRTYDSRFLDGFGAHGIVADPQAASAWYRRGAALGDPQASTLLAAFAATTRR